jgi:hypothetical protein
MGTSPTSQPHRPFHKDIPMNTQNVTPQSLPEADTYADQLVARGLADDQALAACEYSTSGIRLPEGEHWEHYLAAARARQAASLAAGQRDLALEITTQLERFNPPGSPAAAIVVVPTRQNTPAGAITLADDWVEIHVEPYTALRHLSALADGASLGTEDPVEGSVWYALNRAEVQTEEQAPRRTRLAQTLATWIEQLNTTHGLNLSPNLLVTAAGLGHEIGWFLEITEYEAEHTQDQRQLEALWNELTSTASVYRVHDDGAVQDLISDEWIAVSTGAVIRGMQDVVDDLRQRGPGVHWVR